MSSITNLEGFDPKDYGIDFSSAEYFDDVDEDDLEEGVALFEPTEDDQPCESKKTNKANANATFEQK